MAWATRSTCLPPAGGQFSTWQTTIYGDNAFLPASIRSQMTPNQSFSFGRAGDLDYGASKEIEQANTMKSFTTGIKADIGEWKLDGYYQYGRTNSTIYMDNAIRLDRIYQAIDSVRAPNGQIVCRSTLTYRQQRLRADERLRRGLALAGVDRLDHAGHLAASASSSRALRTWRSPARRSTTGQGLCRWPSACRRHDWFTQQVLPDRAACARHADLDRWRASATRACLAFTLAPSTSSSAVLVPRAPTAAYIGQGSVHRSADAAAGGQAVRTRSLDLNTAVRLADYEGSGNVWAWKGGIDWALNDELRIRATPLRVTSAQGRCRSASIPRAVRATSSEGTTPQYAISVVSNGSQNVKPELADTITYGFVYHAGVAQPASRCRSTRST